MVGTTIKCNFAIGKRCNFCMENNLKVFTLPIEEFEKKYPVNCSIEVPGIPKGHVAKIASMLRFIRLNL
mgnify:FL=1